MARISSTRHRVFFIAGLAMGVVFLAEIALREVVDSSFLATRAQRALGTDWNLEIGSARATLVGGRLEASDLRLERTDGLVLTVERISLAGIDLWTAVVHRGLKSDKLEIVAPTLALPPRVPSPPQDQGAPSSAERLTDKIAALPPLATRRLEITSGGLRLPSPDFDGGLVGIRVVADDIDVAATTLRADDRTLFCREIEVTAPSNQWRQGPYRWTLGPLRFSTRDSTVVVDSLAVTPTMSDEAFVASHAYRTDRYDLAVGPLRARLTGWHAWPDTPRMHARSLQVAALWIDVLNDATLPRRPDQPAVRLPHEQLRDLGVKFAIDTLRVGGGTVQYRERPATGGEIGNVRFADLAATVTGLANYPASAASHRPTVFTITSRLFSSASLAVRLQYDLLAEALDLAASGTLGALPATTFDAVLAPLEGLRFDGGSLDSLRFAYHLDEAQATGDLGIRFHDLALAASSRKPGQGPFHGLKVVFANALLLNSDAAAGTDTLRTFPIAYTRQPQDPFFKYLWASLRSGLLSSLGL